MKKKSDETRKSKTESQDLSNMHKGEKAADKSRHEEQMFRTLADQSSDLIFLVDQEMVITYGNPTLERDLGLTAEEVIGSHIFAHLHPDDLKLLTNIFKTMLRDTNANFQRVEVRLHHKNGSWKTFSARGSNFLHDSAVEAVIINLQDITNLKKAEEALRDSEHKFRETLVNLDEGYFSTTLNGTLLEHNKALNHILGFDINEDLKGFNIPDLWQNKEDRQDYLRAFAATGSIAKYQINAKTQQGEKITLSASAHFVKDENNRPLRIEGIVLDITERKRAEESLKETELKFRTIFDCASDGIILLNLGTGNFSAANEKMCNMLGYTNEELLNLSIPDIHPQESIPFVIDQSDKLLKKEILIAKNIPVIKKDKTVFFADISGSPIILGEQEYLIGMFRDITERKQTEEKLRFEQQRFQAFVEHSSDIILIVNQEGIITYINPAVERILGFKVEERIGANGFERIHPDDLKFVTDKFNILVRDTTSPVLKTEIHLRHKDGSWRTLEAVGSNLVNNNVVESIIVNYRDITDRKKAEEMLLFISKAVENSSDAIAISDPQGNHFYQNKKSTELSEYTLEELKNAGGATVLYANKDIVREVFDTITGGKLWRGEVEMISKSGRKIPVILSADAIKDENGEIVGLIGVHTDITERKRAESQNEAMLEVLQKSEQKYRLLFDEMISGYAVHEIICDQTGKPVNYRFLAVNQAFEKMTGLNSADIIGRTVLDVLPDTEPIWIERYGQVALTRETTQFENYSSALGKYYEVRAFSLEPGKFATIFNDITDRKKAEGKTSI
jgi:PAS domain S-box-containing protein